jgi:hypothetical protein
MTAPSRTPQLLFTFAVLLALGGVVAFAMSGFEAYTALIPVGMGVLIAVCGVLASRPEQRPSAGRAGSIAGLLLASVYTLMFAYLTYSRGTRDEIVVYQVAIFIVLAFISGAFVALLLKARR